MTESNFLDIIQEHERTWGNDNYANRPTLAELLNAPIVAFWGSAEKAETRRMATTHDDLAELDKFAGRLLLQLRNAVPANRYLHSVYINQKKAIVRGVRFDIVEGE